MQYSKKLARYIKNRRKQLGISLNQFAFDASMEPATLSRIENGLVEVRTPSLIKLARGFCCTPGEFLIAFENFYKIKSV